MTDPPSATKQEKIYLIALAPRVFLACLGIASLSLAALENQEVIGTAFVGAAIAFSLAAAFFDRVIEVSTKGVKLGDIRAMEASVEQEVPQADPDEREELVEEGSEILATRRSAGKPITPDLALREASISWQRNGLAVEWRLATWLIERGWSVKQGEQTVATTQPDLVAEKDGQQIAVEIKVGRRPVGVNAVDQALSQAASLEAISAPGPDRGPVQPVLVLGEVPLTKAATVAATEKRVSVYLLDAKDFFTHLAGPELH
jgi:hypothetical protein